MYCTTMSAISTARVMCQDEISNKQALFKNFFRVGCLTYWYASFYLCYSMQHEFNGILWWYLLLHSVAHPSQPAPNLHTLQG